MLIRQKQLSNGALIGIWQITETEDQLLSLFDQPDDVHKVLEGISNVSKRCEKLAVRALLKLLLGNEKSILYNEAGKPFLEDKSYNISISHTDGYATIMAHPFLEVGIDIELLSPRAAQLQQRFLSSSELQLIHKTDDFVVPLLLWTAKEALYKFVSNSEIEFVEHIKIIAIDQKKQQMKGLVFGMEHPLTLFYEINKTYVLTYVWSI